MPDDFSNPYDPSNPTGELPPEQPPSPSDPGGTGGSTPGNPAPEPPRMLSAALFGSPEPGGTITIAKSGGSDADFAALFDRAAAQLRA